MTINAQFQWECHPKSETLLTGIISKYTSENPAIANLEKDLNVYTSTRLFDWIDHIVIGYSEEIERDLESDGFVAEGTTATYRILHHPRAQFPRVVLNEDATKELGIAVNVDSIANFLMVNGISRIIEGTFLSAYRRTSISIENNIALWIVERRCSHTMEPIYADDDSIKNYLLAEEIWKTRPRNICEEEEAMAQAIHRAEKIVNLIGTGLGAWVVMECEREYWQARNTAAQIQKSRQDRLGMGWANHDHHTFRSSRKHFNLLLRLFEILGFQCRERFYAGQEAGWGAQVMEHPETRLVLFLDVDLLPHEVEIDFRHQSLKPLKELKTVGLWCALHGDSILKSGMHHLEAQFLFDQLKSDLSSTGVNMMEPFSNFPFLKQAFTKGEMWRVDTDRIQALLEDGMITNEQADKFLKSGAVGSHMENLQRREGYKGFNQKNVSFIIQKTDPRTINF